MDRPSLKLTAERASWRSLREEGGKELPGPPGSECARNETAEWRAAGNPFCLGWNRPEWTTHFSATLRQRK